MSKTATYLGGSNSTVDGVRRVYKLSTPIAGHTIVFEAVVYHGRWSTTAEPFSTTYFVGPAWKINEDEIGFNYGDEVLANQSLSSLGYQEI